MFAILYAISNLYASNFYKISLSSVSPMNNLYIVVVVLVGITATGLLLAFIFSSSSASKKAFEASDGTKFSNEKELKEYEFLYERLKCLYDETISSSQSKKNTNLSKKKFPNTY